MARARRQRLGQHFLVDEGIAAGIVGLLADEPAQVLEIGPGQGALTTGLLDRFGSLLALELDARLHQELHLRFAGKRGLDLRHADALHEPLQPLLGAAAPWQVAANLPYSVGSAIVRRLLPRHDLIRRLVVMLQLEVVERIVAEPGHREHGLLALERAAYGVATIAFRVPPQAFRPRPKVESAVVVIELTPPARPASELAQAFALASLAFRGRRKMLGTVLRGRLDPEQISAAGIDPKTRPNLLGLDDWLRLAAITGIEGRQDTGKAG